MSGWDCIKLMMHTQKQEQKIKTIDLNDFLDGFHNYRTTHNDRDTIKAHPFAMKLRSHLNPRADTCFSIQTFTPHTRPSSRRPPPSRYETARPHREEPPSDLENINLDEFVHAILGRERRVEEEGVQEFMRSLNGTWFQGTNQQFKCAKIYNTLGIKKSRSAGRPRSERYNPESLREKVDFTKEIRPNGLFPSRKTHISRKIPRTATAIPHHISPNKCQGSLKQQIVRSIQQEMQGRTVSRGSVRPNRTAGSPLSNQKLASRSGQAIVKVILSQMVSMSNTAYIFTINLVYARLRSYYMFNIQYKQSLFRIYHSETSLIFGMAKLDVYALADTAYLCQKNNIQLNIIMVKSHPTVIAIGQHKGHPTTAFKASEKKSKRIRPAQKKGALGKRVKLIRQVIGEVGGVSTYEKRVIEFLKAGSVKDTKRALKLSKKALGTHRRAKLKRESLMNLLRAQQAKAKK